jgi:NAD+ synthase
MNKHQPSFHKDILKLKDPESTLSAICSKLQDDVFKTLKKTGGIVGTSGGIDSSLTLAIAVRALGADRVTGIMLPEKDSSQDSEMLARELADRLGVKIIKEEITGCLEGFGAYQRRDEAVKRVFPEYDPAIHKMKIGIKKSGLLNNLAPLFHLTIIDSEGNEKDKRLPLNEYLQIVAASNFKQRTRMSFLYYHAELNNYAVIGTPNIHEREQGFFVKHGDGAADVMPIERLYKTQVYQLAEYMGVPENILKRTPTTDTYTAEQTQEEFFFQMPFKELDLYWYAFINNLDKTEVAEVMNESPDNVEAIFRNFERKKRSTEYLRMAPITDY